MRGRKPKPERLRLIDNQVRVIGGGEPPKAPDWLDGDARAEFDRIVSELVKNFLVTPLDGVALASYCRMYAMWREADKQVREQGITFIADSGNVRCNPAAKLCLSLFEAMRRMASEFGFTPAARSRLQCPKPESQEADEFESFLEER